MSEVGNKGGEGVQDGEKEKGSLAREEGRQNGVRHDACENRRRECVGA